MVLDADMDVDALLFVSSSRYVYTINGILFRRTENGFGTKIVALSEGAYALHAFP